MYELHVKLFTDFVHLHLGFRSPHEVGICCSLMSAAALTDTTWQFNSWTNQAKFALNMFKMATLHSAVLRYICPRLAVPLEVLRALL
jgi:hypothetical protein